MPRYIQVIAAIILLYPASGMAGHDTETGLDKDVAAIWDACDRLFGPAPDPSAAKRWTADEKQRATEVVDCFTEVQRKLREISIQATDRRTAI